MNRTRNRLPLPASSVITLQPEIRAAAPEVSREVEVEAFGQRREAEERSRRRYASAWLLAYTAGPLILGLGLLALARAALSLFP